MFWYKKRHVRYGNFGDELGPYIVSRLSGRPIEYVPIPRTGIYLVATFIIYLMRHQFEMHDVQSLFRTFIRPANYITTVGSIIGWPRGSRTVWGSGILFYNERVENGRFLAVRGAYTQRRLQTLGYECPDVIGDPALLLPLVYSPKGERTGKVGIIPHHTQYEALASSISDPMIRVINLLDDIESVIDAITSCDRIISMSLHGLIVAHAYRVPALWYEYHEIQWHGSDVKFFDYFSSVGIKEYVPHQFPTNNERMLEIIEESFQTADAFSIIHSDLKLIQKKLLDVAPFCVLPEYMRRLSQCPSIV